LRAGTSPTKLSSLRNPPAGKAGNRSRKPAMTWSTPILVEICIGLEINGYLPAEF
jgi:coenzyme PQQ precursor peptide PqqA